MSELLILSSTSSSVNSILVSSSISSMSSPNASSISSSVLSATLSISISELSSGSSLLPFIFYQFVFLVVLAFLFLFGAPELTFPVVSSLL